MQLCYGRCRMSQEPTRPIQPRSRWGRGWGGVLDRCSAVFYCEREVDASGPSTCLSLSTNAQLSHSRYRASCEHAWPMWVRCGWERGGGGGSKAIAVSNSNRLTNVKFMSESRPTLTPPTAIPCRCAADMAGIGCHTSPQNPCNPGLGGEESGVKEGSGRTACPGD